MMKNESMAIGRILKYNLDIFDNPATRQIEADCVSIAPLSVAEQDGGLMLWAFITQREGENKKHRVNVRVIGTGHHIFLGREDLPGELEGMRFTGTVVMKSTGYVWHVYASEKGALSEDENT